MRFLIYLLPILYVLSPYDLLPDFILGAGWVDDLIVLGLLAWYLLRYRPRKQRAQGETWGYQYFKGGSRARSKEGGPFDQRPNFEGQTEDLDPYQVLEVEQGASAEEVKAAYRRLASQYHPDKLSHLGEEFKILAERRFKEIQEAYEQLNPRGR